MDLISQYVRFIFDEWEKDKAGWITKTPPSVADYRLWFVENTPCTCPGFHPAYCYHVEEDHRTDCYGIRVWLVGEMCGGCFGCISAQQSYYNSLEEK